MAADRVVVGQTAGYMVFMALMALLLAALGMIVVQRSFFEALPAGLLILGIFALLGFHVFSSRLVLEGATLTSFRYGRRLWQVDVRRAQFRETKDDIGAFVLEVLIDDRKVGSLRSTLYERVAFDALLERMDVESAAWEARS